MMCIALPSWRCQKLDLEPLQAKYVLSHWAAWLPPCRFQKVTHRTLTWSTEIIVSEDNPFGKKYIFTDLHSYISIYYHPIFVCWFNRHQPQIEILPYIQQLIQGVVIYCSRLLKTDWNYVCMLVTMCYLCLLVKCLDFAPWTPLSVKLVAQSYCTGWVVSKLCHFGHCYKGNVLAFVIFPQCNRIVMSSSFKKKQTQNNL